jgi:hypothetical protein
MGIGPYSCVMQCGKYGYRTVQLCNGVWLENRVVNMGIELYSCVIECGYGKLW